MLSFVVILISIGYSNVANSQTECICTTSSNPTPFPATTVSSAELTIFIISNINESTTATSIVGGQWIAIQEINNNSDLLPNYKLNLKTYDSGRDLQKALIHALNVSSYQNTIHHSYFPIILGCVWSSLSISTAPVLSAFNMGQISGASTSITLSETSKYPYFYRTVPSDSMQAEGLIFLCTTFNWTSVAVIYVNDAYGLYLSLGIQALATQHGIDVTSIAVSEYDAITYSFAAKQIKDLNLFIIIIVVHDNNILDVFREFENEGIVGYPYLYLGCDAWLDQAIIHKYNLTKNAVGTIGTVPWQPDSLPLNQYSSDIRNIITESIKNYHNLLSKWQHYYNNGYAHKLHDIETPGSKMIYGYDAIYTLVHTIQEIDQNPELYGGNLFQLLNSNDGAGVIKIIHDIIVNKTDFVGTSGRVMFDQIGDRVNGLYLFGNILEDESVAYFGYLYKNMNGSIASELNKSKIIWPQYFIDKGIAPRSDVLTHYELITIPNPALITTCVISILSILVALICIVLSVYYRENRIIMAGSWKLNIILCVGAVLMCIRVAMYGYEMIDEMYVDFECNLRIWLTTVAFTLLFMPLFAKTYRLSQIFNQILHKKVMQDKQLFILIAVCVLIDIILLTIFTSIKPLQRLTVEGNIEPIDEIQQIQYTYAQCTFEDEHFSTFFWCFYGLIIFWKIIQSLWGVHVALTVSRVGSMDTSMSKQLIRFDETGAILFSILFTFVVICIAVPLLTFGILTKNVIVYYAVMVITSLLIVNVVVSTNLFPRLWAVVTGHEEKFKISAAQKMETKMKKELLRLANEQSWLDSVPVSVARMLTSASHRSPKSTTPTANSEPRFHPYHSVGASSLSTLGKGGNTIIPLTATVDHNSSSDED